MIHFVLLAHVRSGSPVLVRSLAEHRNVRMFGELFNPDENERARAYSQISRCKIARRRGLDASMYYRDGDDGGLAEGDDEGEATETEAEPNNGPVYAALAGV